MVSIHPLSKAAGGTGYVNQASQGFGKLLREAREAAGQSQSELGRNAGYDHSYISRLEFGARQPTIEAVERITKALGLSTPESALLKMAAGYLPGRASPTTLRLLAALESASPELCQWAEQTLEVITSHLERART